MGEAPEVRRHALASLRDPCRTELTGFDLVRDLLRVTAAGQGTIC